jgi:hypothetical protein
MAATKTRKPAAKKTTAKKASTPKAPKIQTTGKGRTTPALVNRHRWSATELEALATKVAKAGPSKAKRDAVYAATAKKIGNGISAASVRAQYYAHMRKSGQPVGQPRGTAAPRVPKAGNVPVIGKAPKYDTDPVQKVKAMVQRRGQVTRAVEQSTARQATIASQIEALTAEAAKHAAVVEQGNAELATLNAALGVFA